MPEQISFGRRQTPLGAPTPLVSPEPPGPTPPRAGPAPPADGAALSPEAEAFRAQLALERAPAESSFTGWMRAQQSGRLVAWLLTFALLSPGLMCFIFGAPAYVSTGLEVTGVVANVWLRQARRRHLREIASWDPQT